MEYDPSKYPQRVGRQKHFLDIDFHFNDGPRSGPSRRRGRERTQRIWNGNQNGGPVNNGTDVEGSSAAVRNGNNERRRPPQQNNRNRNTDRLHKRGYVSDLITKSIKLVFILIFRCFQFLIGGQTRSKCSQSLR